MDLSSSAFIAAQREKEKEREREREREREKQNKGKGGKKETEKEKGKKERNDVCSHHVRAGKLAASLPRRKENRDRLHLY